jgi:hypothetical protein
MARAGSHSGGRRGPLSGVDLPPERRPQSAARDPLQTYGQVKGCGGESHKSATRLLLDDFIYGQRLDA